jgi:hypothetical protein
MKKKVNQEVERLKLELTMLEVKQKAELLLTRKQLQDAGVCQAEIDKLLPI